MSDKVVHGTGKPRIVIVEDTATITAVTINSVSGLTAVLTGTPTLTDAVIGRYLVTQNSDSNTTRGKITGFDDSADSVTVDFWDNRKPETTKAAEIIHKVIDLPYCQNNLIERFLPERIVHKLVSGKKNIKLKGFWYFGTFDYSLYQNKEDLENIQEIYDTARANHFLVMPRRDNPFIEYECEIAETEFEIAQLLRHQGHKMTVFNFEGINRLSKIDLTTQKPLPDYVGPMDDNEVIPMDDNQTIPVDDLAEI